MATSIPPPSNIKRSVARLRRLTPMLDERLDDPAVALELLVAEAEIGELHPDLWERLHAAAERDGELAELGAAYEQVARAHRLRTLDPTRQVVVFMHAEALFRTYLRDPERAAGMLRKVLEIAPDHAEAFARLDQHLTSLKRNLELVELLASVAAVRHESPVLLVGRALALVELLPTDQQVSFEACERLVRAAPMNPRVVTVLEAHCRAGQRFREAAALYEIAIERGTLSSVDVLELRRRALSLYLGELKAPDSAIVHVEEIFQVDPGHADALKAAERLLAHPSAAKRAAVILQARRRMITQGS